MHEIVKEINGNKARVLQKAEEDLMGNALKHELPKTREEAANQHENNGGTCFPGTSIVWTKEMGWLALSELSTQNHVLALDAAGRIAFSKVCVISIEKKKINRNPCILYLLSLANYVC
jgi:hypothetical protein